MPAGLAVRLSPSRSERELRVHALNARWHIYCGHAKCGQCILVWLRSQQNCYCFAFTSRTQHRDTRTRSLSSLITLYTHRAHLTSLHTQGRSRFSCTKLPAESRCTFSRSQAAGHVGATPWSVAHMAYECFFASRGGGQCSTALVARSVRLGHGAGGGHAGLIICSRRVRSVRSSAGETS